MCTSENKRAVRLKNAALPLLGGGAPLAVDPGQFVIGRGVVLNRMLAQRGGHGAMRTQTGKDPSDRQPQ